MDERTKRIVHHNVKMAELLFDLKHQRVCIEWFDKCLVKRLKRSLYGIDTID